MTEDEFRDAFGPMAMIHFRSVDGLRNVASGYYEEVKGFINTVLYEVMIDIEKDYNNKYFPGPQGLKELCRVKVKTRLQKREEESGGITDEEVNSVGNILARRNFFFTLAKLHDKNAMIDGKMSNLAHCLGGAIILGPFERAKLDEEREALKKKKCVRVDEMKEEF